MALNATLQTSRFLGLIKMPIICLVTIDEACRNIKPERSTTLTVLLNARRSSQQLIDAV
jgi:hypothetical protein